MQGTARALGSPLLEALFGSKRMYMHSQPMLRNWAWLAYLLWETCSMLAQHSLQAMAALQSRPCHRSSVAVRKHTGTVGAPELTCGQTAAAPPAAALAVLRVAAAVAALVSTLSG